MEMKQRKCVQRQLLFARAYGAHIQNVYMLTITQTDHFVVTDSALVVEVFTGGSSSEVQSRPRHHLCTYRRIDVEQCAFVLLLFKLVPE